MTQHLPSPIISPQPAPTRGVTLSSYVLMAGALLLIMWQGLVPGMLCVCVGFLVTRALAGLLARAQPKARRGSLPRWTQLVAATIVILAPLALLVACAIGLSTVVFQTVSHNTILTPSVMGLDALYLFVQASMVLMLGAAGVSAMGEVGRYALNIVLMMGFSVLLMRWLFVGHASSLHLMLLVGMVGGIFFRSLAGLAMRVLDPNEFTALQDRMFANFNAVNLQLLVPSLLLAVV